jgi:hypothetical protein
VPLGKIALCQQHVHAVGKEFSFFRILNSNFLVALLHCLQAHG